MQSALRKIEKVPTLPTVAIYLELWSILGRHEVELGDDRRWLYGMEVNEESEGKSLNCLVCS